jgi:HSP20 family protein
MPGMAKEDVKIWLENDTLTVSGEKKRVVDGNATTHFSERNYGRFERSFQLPVHVDRKNVHADFVNGVLEITLPKTPESRIKEVSIN